MSIYTTPILRPTDAVVSDDIELRPPFKRHKKNSSESILSPLTYRQAPMYLQTPECEFPTAFRRSSANRDYWVGKLAVPIQQTQFLSKLETLQTRCKQLLLDHNDAWFKGQMDADMVDDAFESLSSVGRAGTLATVRVVVPATASEEGSSEPALSVYRTPQETMLFQDLSFPCNATCILQPVGIVIGKSTFTMEFEVKQMLLRPAFFEQCRIQTTDGAAASDGSDKNAAPAAAASAPPTSDDVDMELQFESLDEALAQPVDMEQRAKQGRMDDDEDDDEGSDEGSDEEPRFPAPTEDQRREFAEARERAKVAKRAALVALLEAKRLKQMYHIVTSQYAEDFENSGDLDDIDNDIDAVSEADLDEWEPSGDAADRTGAEPGDDSADVLDDVLEDLELDEMERNDVPPRFTVALKAPPATAAPVAPIDRAAAVPLADTNRAGSTEADDVDLDDLFDSL